MEGKILGIELVAGLGGHGDLMVMCPTLGAEFKCDSYYFGLDKSLGVNREDFGVNDRIVEILCRYFETVAECLSDRKYYPVYIAFDISDEYVRFIQVSYQGTTTELAIGWSRTPGYAITISDICELTFDDVSLALGPVPINIEDLIVDLKLIIEQLRSDPMIDPINN